MKRTILWSLSGLILAGSLFHDYVIKVMCRCPPDVGFKITITDYRFLTDLKSHVQYLASDLGERNLSSIQSLTSAEKYILDYWREIGYLPQKQTFLVNHAAVSNLIIEKTGMHKPKEIIIVGAHYDSALGSPGADDNASGVAAMLVLSKLFQKKELTRTLRFVAFVNKEPPFFGTDQMGSRRYAAEIARHKDQLLVMMSLDSMGFYTSAKDSQHYPLLIRWLYPDQGNFLGFLGNVGSRGITNVVTSLFRTYSDLPAQCAKINDARLANSDHSSFWKEGYPAIQVTDLAESRHPGYRSPEDTIDKIDFVNLDKAVEGLYQTIEALTESKDFQPEYYPDIS